MDAPELRPSDLEHVRTTPTFDEHTVPAGLRAAHALAAGVWGRLVVAEGALIFAFEDAPDEAVTIAAGGEQIIPPQRPHHVVTDQPVRFAIEMYRSR